MLRLAEQGAAFGFTLSSRPMPCVPTFGLQGGGLHSEPSALLSIAEHRPTVQASAAPSANALQTPLQNLLFVRGRLQIYDLRTKPMQSETLPHKSEAFVRVVRLPRRGSRPVQKLCFC